MKYIEVNVWIGIVDINMPKGLWLFNNIIYLSQANGTFPFALNIPFDLIKEKKQKEQKKQQ
jgi:hypothetical protein